MFTKSKFLERFQRAAGTRKGVLHGDLILIEILDAPEDAEEGLKKSAGGLFIPESQHARSDYVMLKAMVGVVLEVGAGYVDKAGKEIPLEVQPGNIVWVSEKAVAICSTVPGIHEALPAKTLALTSASEIKKSWTSIADYDADRVALNEIE